jgi:hypothetical protein
MDGPVAVAGLGTTVGHLAVGETADHLFCKPVLVSPGHFANDPQPRDVLDLAEPGGLAAELVGDAVDRLQPPGGRRADDLGSTAPTASRTGLRSSRNPLSRRRSSWLGTSAFRSRSPSLSTWSWKGATNPR